MLKMFVFLTSKDHHWIRRCYLYLLFFFTLPLLLFLFQLAEYRQRKAHADSQKKQKKKKKKNPAEDSAGDSQRGVEVEPDPCLGREEVSGGGQDGSQEENADPPTTEFTIARTLRSGETVKQNQTYTIEVDKTTASLFTHRTPSIYDL